MIPPSPDHAPIAAARSSDTKLASRIARLPGVSSAAPMPCSARAAMSTSAFGAIAHSSDAAANHATPMRNTLAPPEPVTERAAEQEEAGERQRVGVDDPLQAREPGVEVLADRRRARC